MALQLNMSMPCASINRKHQFVLVFRKPLSWRSIKHIHIQYHTFLFYPSKKGAFPYLTLFYRRKKIPKFQITLLIFTLCDSEQNAKIQTLYTFTHDVHKQKETLITTTFYWPRMCNVVSSIEYYTHYIDRFYKVTLTNKWYLFFSVYY